MAKEMWIQGLCQEVEACLRKSNCKKAYQFPKAVTTERQGKSTTIQNHSEKCLIGEHEILNRWTEYCTYLYNCKTEGGPTVRASPQMADEEHHPILRGGRNISQSTEDGKFSWSE